MFRGSMMLILAGVFWGASGTLQAFGPEGISPLVLGAIRITVGGLCLTVFVLCREGGKAFSGRWPWKDVLMASAGMALYQQFFFASILRTGVAVGTMVAIGSSPVMGGLLGRLFLGERLTARWVGATVAAVTGCALLSLGGSLTVDPMGILLALCAGTSFGFLGMGMKKAQEGRSSLAAIALCMTLGAVLASPAFFLGYTGWIFTPRGISIALILGAVSTAIPYGLYSTALKVVPVSTACTLTLAEPLTAAVFGVSLLGERLSIPALVGIGFILFGLVLLSVPNRRTAIPGDAVS